MATTYKDVINRVLVKLGEDEIGDADTEITASYHKLVGAFVNDFKEEVEDAHNWRALRQTFSVTAAQDELANVITGATDRSRLVRIFQAENARTIPLVFDITDAANPIPLIEMDLSQLLYRDLSDPDTRQDPSYFALDNSEGDVLKLCVWPRPSGNRTISIALVVPQPRFTSDQLMTNIKVPVKAIEYGALWYATEERGEELGANGLFTEQRYRDALSESISRDSAEAGDTLELVLV